jgi:DNA repair protein RecO (recombination protein O)
LLPPAEPNEKFFRLLLAVLEALHATPGGSAMWRTVTYFSLWAVRLSGWLPELDVCLSCGSVLDDPQSPERAFFSRGRPGLLCDHCRRLPGVGSSWELSGESRRIAVEMLRQPVSQISPSAWSQATAADLRRFLIQQIETHVERRLLTPPMLEECVSIP